MVKDSEPPKTGMRTIARILMALIAVWLIIWMLHLAGIDVLYRF